MPLQTPTILPALDSRSRFGTVSFGYDRINALREEHSLLASTVALAIGCAVEDLTVAKVTAWRDDLMAEQEEEQARTLAEQDAASKASLQK
jgi:hypothetical protein